MLIYFKNSIRITTKNICNSISVRLCSNLPKSKSCSQLSVKAYGQPTATTHPHLIKDGEITPFIQRSEFQERRQRLVESIVAHSLNCDKNSKTHLIVIPSASKQFMSDKIPYVFRQNSDFLYLSGCLEPDSCLVLATSNSLNNHHAVMFMREKDSHSELWDGPRTSCEDCINLFGVEQALPITELGKYLECYMKSNGRAMLWYDFLAPIQKTVDSVMKEFLDEKFNKMWESPIMFVHRLRLIKSHAEIQLMQKSCDIAAESIANTISFSRPGVTEHQIFAHVDYECKMKGAEYLAYPPVVAGGNRANIIHYINNNQVVANNEMVLMDAGCEYHGYSSDITRTWPVNGKFTPEQAVVYEILLDIQKRLIELCYTFPSLDNLFDAMCSMLGKHLEESGLIRRSFTENPVRVAYKFCPHHVSHYLGMDVHDTPSVPRNIRVQPGMIITMEPGMYIHSGLKVPKEYQGMGIRIEDDVLITNDGPVVLTKKCPNKLEDIEKIASENQRA
ncbi:hypothetical protein PPYR_10415 [Photinus pyralis]|uniref:Aminopeptidase P N-terminal domain-containing protein n=2 Tax=Photinus pyralis TaxID=7054 RepID=A0A1Y1KRI0_PHOPY|nr:xaa-Pro aminopeptidase 3-like isoform X1 [Photinus pyralis]KAB0796354.1 hypothetical protein PPYR_10415 [Photinus pyralis]